ADADYRLNAKGLCPSPRIVGEIDDNLIALQHPLLRVAAFRHGRGKGLDHMAVGHDDPVADQKRRPDVLATGINAANRAEYRLDLWLRQGEGAAPRPEFRMVDVDRAVLNANGRSIGETNQGLERSSLRT